MTVYDQNPARWDEIGKTRPFLCQMAKLQVNITEMEYALGYKGGGSTIRKWITGHNGISEHSENVARQWLHRGAYVPPKVSAHVPAAVKQSMVLILCDAAKVAKVTRVLEVMGCEVVEVDND